MDKHQVASQVDISEPKEGDMANIVKVEFIRLAPKSKRPYAKMHA